MSLRWGSEEACNLVSGGSEEACNLVGGGSEGACNLVSGGSEGACNLVGGGSEGACNLMGGAQRGPVNLSQIYSTNFGYILPTLKFIVLLTWPRSQALPTKRKEPGNKAITKLTYALWTLMIAEKAAAINLLQTMEL